MKKESFFDELEFSDNGIEIEERDVLSFNGEVQKEFDTYSASTLIRKVDGTIWKIVGNKIVRVQDKIIIE